jgi:hypothetical protein
MGAHTSKAYTFFNSQLIDTAYAIGDVYDKDTVAAAQLEWEFTYVESILRTQFYGIRNFVLCPSNKKASL